MKNKWSVLVICIVGVVVTASLVFLGTIHPVLGMLVGIVLGVIIAPKFKQVLESWLS